MINSLENKLIRNIFKRKNINNYKFKEKVYY